MNKWIRRHLEVAKMIANWSKDPSTRVGCRIVDGRQRVVSEGFNGPPRGVADDPAISREAKLRRTLHAEANALLFAPRDVAGCTLYVTHPPCAQCAAKIVQAGITHVVTADPGAAFRTRWADDLAEAQQIFAEAGVPVEVVE